MVSKILRVYCTSKQKRGVVVSKYWRCRRWVAGTSIKRKKLLFTERIKLELKRILGVQEKVLEVEGEVPLRKYSII